MKITAPIGIRIMPQSATKSSSCMVTMGKMAVTLAIRPVISVTLKREDLGMSDWKARPAR